MISDEMIMEMPVVIPTATATLNQVAGGAVTTPDYEMKDDFDDNWIMITLMMKTTTMIMMKLSVMMTGDGDVRLHVHAGGSQCGPTGRRGQTHALQQEL